MTLQDTTGKIYLGDPPTNIYLIPTSLNSFLLIIDEGIWLTYPAFYNFFVESAQTLQTVQKVSKVSDTILFCELTLPCISGEEYTLTATNFEFQFGQEYYKVASLVFDGFTLPPAATPIPSFFKDIKTIFVPNGMEIVAGGDFHTSSVEETVRQIAMAIITQETAKMPWGTLDQSDLQLKTLKVNLKEVAARIRVGLNRISAVAESEVDVESFRDGFKCSVKIRLKDGAQFEMGATLDG